MAQQSLELRPMGVGDIFDVILRMYRSRFVPFIMIALAVYIPYGIIAGLFQQSVVEGASAVGPQDPSLAIGGAVLMFIMAFVAMPLCQGAMLHQISAAYLGNPIGAAESYRRALPRLVRLLLANILVGIIVMIGFLLLIVPGIIFSLWFMLVTAVVMMESHGVTSSLGRSKELMSGNLGKGLMIGVVIFILNLLIGIIAGSVMAFVIPAESLLLQNIANTALQAVVIPIQVGAIVLFYYDLRIRKEAFDLEQLATQLNQAMPESPAGDVQPPLAP